MSITGLSLSAMRTQREIYTKFIVLVVLPLRTGTLDCYPLKTHLKYPLKGPHKATVPGPDESRKYIITVGLQD